MNWLRRLVDALRGSSAPDPTAESAPASAGQLLVATHRQRSVALRYNRMLEDHKAMDARLKRFIQQHY